MRDSNTGELTYEGYNSNVTDIIKEVSKDICFYEESGGGMTLSGGEVLQHPAFAGELLKAAKKAGIHTACETTCYTDSYTFENFLEHLDLLLCDVKHYDSQKHEGVVGVPLAQIHANIRYAVDIGKKVIARIPVIPGFNYTLDDANNFCKLLQNLGITEVSLLPFHNYGENKYALLGMPYTMSDVDSLHKTDDDFIKYTNVFVQHGFTIK